MNPIKPVAVVLGRQPWLPKFAKSIVGLDLLIQKVSRGRLTLLSVAGLPELTLSVAGRKSGLIRRTPLLYAPHPAGPLVAGSNWGQEKPPAWVGNLRAAESASIEIKGRSSTVTPRELAGAEREAKLAEMTKVWPNYRHYVERAHPRVIPIFQLEPTDR
ncbi:MAG TPA: nitroreductase family deazaflavin-dependent oxidoreductase [Marmoricola sp.]|nr:nitroreductase family deazaflavin-dependent oxidoreductase [Marmoricola sp.]